MKTGTSVTSAEEADSAALLVPKKLVAVTLSRRQLPTSALTMV
ncbi:MAG: hypothetical protein ACO3GC_05675 [Ilumatobacteraceae bacterium]